MLVQTQCRHWEESPVGAGVVVVVEGVVVIVVGPIFQIFSSWFQYMNLSEDNIENPVFIIRGSHSSILVCLRVVVDGVLAAEGVDSLASAGGCRWSLNSEPRTDGESCQPALDIEEEEGGLYHHGLSRGVSMNVQ